VRNCKRANVRALRPRHVGRRNLTAEGKPVPRFRAAPGWNETSRRFAKTTLSRRHLHEHPIPAEIAL
jgi:hypothetical protein